MNQNNNCIISLLQDKLSINDFAELLSKGYSLSDIAELHNMDFTDVYTLFCNNKSQLTAMWKSDTFPTTYQVRLFSRKFLISAMIRLKTVHAVAQRYNLSYYEVVKELNFQKLEVYIPFFKNKLDPETLKFLYIEKHFSDELIGKIFNMVPRTIALERRKYNISAKEEKEKLSQQLFSGLYYDLAVNYRFPLDKIMDVTNASKNILTNVRQDLLRTLPNEEKEKLTVWDNSKNSDTITAAFIRKKFYLNQL